MREAGLRLGKAALKSDGSARATKAVGAPSTRHTPPGPATRRRGWPPEGLSSPGPPELKATLSYKNNNTPRPFDFCFKILLVMLAVDHLQGKADLANF